MATKAGFWVGLMVLCGGFLNNGIVEGGWSTVHQFGAGLTVLGVDCGSPYKVWVVGLNEATSTNQIHHSSDGGDTWSRQYSGMDFCVFMLGVDFADEYNGWVAGGKVIGFPSEGVGAVTHDGGVSWQPIPMAIGLAMFQSVYALDSQNVFMTGFWGMLAPTEGIRITQNGGLTWQTKTVTSQSSVRYSHFINSQVGWLTAGTWPDRADDYYVKVLDDGSKQGMYKYRRFEHDSVEYDIPCEAAQMKRADTYITEVLHTTDGGNSWVQQFYNEGNYYPNDLWFIDQNNGWVTVEADLSSRLLHTTDGGASWTEVFYLSGNQHGLSDVQFVSSNEGWAFGMGAGGVNPQTAIIHTTDGGQMWTRENVFEPAGIMYGSMIDRHRGWTSGGNNMKISRVIRYDDGYYQGTPEPTPPPTMTPTPATPQPSQTPTSEPTTTPVDETRTPTPWPSPTTTEVTPTPEPTTPADSGIYVYTNQQTYYPNEAFQLWVTLLNREGYGLWVDEYIVLEVYAQYYFWPTWTTEMDSVSLYMTPGYRLEDLILNFIWPSDVDTIHGITFWAALMRKDTYEVFGSFSQCTCEFVHE